jgi:hypothetical protein
MRAFVAAEIDRLPLNACETVLLLTPACSATSAMVTRFITKSLNLLPTIE